MSNKTFSQEEMRKIVNEMEFARYNSFYARENQKREADLYYKAQMKAYRDQENLEIDKAAGVSGIPEVILYLTLFIVSILSFLGVDVNNLVDKIVLFFENLKDSFHYLDPAYIIMFLFILAVLKLLLRLFLRK